MRHHTCVKKLFKTSARWALVLSLAFTLICTSSGCAHTSAPERGKVGQSTEATQSPRATIEPTVTASIDSTATTTTLLAGAQSVHATPTATPAPTPQAPAALQTPPAPQIEPAPQPGKKYVALTFDDGPSLYTPRVLAILKEKNVHATFFVIGRQIERGSKTLLQSRQMGNQIANHTLKHRYFPTKSTELLKKDVTKTRLILKRYTGVDTTYVRLPYGATNKRINKALKQMGMKKIFWTHDTRDWARPGVKRVVHNAITNVRNGSIILMHDGGGTREQTLKALPLIIDRLKAQGYTFVTVEQLYAMGIKR